MQPQRSPTSQAQQLLELVHLPLVAYWTDKEMVRAGLRASPAAGAKERAMW